MPGEERGELEARVAAMISALAHRGPDGRGEYVHGGTGVALGHARLSILDLSDAGRQPMTSPDGQLVVTFNGEVYNFRELRRELDGWGSFRSGTDTEVVLAAYARWGVAALQRLNGMFALAILDLRRGKLVLARDRLGIKPLFLIRNASGVAFASEIVALGRSGLDRGTVDPSALHEFVYFGATLGRRTLFSEVRKVPPGVVVEIDLASRIATETRYWTPPSPESRPRRSFDEVVPEVREILNSAVKRQLVSDVPVGVFLSGGVDSTALVAWASQAYSGRLRTFSAGFDYVGDAAELPAARAVADRFGTEHHEIQIRGSDIGRRVEHLVAATDAPFGDAANLPLHQLSEALGGATKVILQGDGGDEIFGGYRRYQSLSSSVSRVLSAAGRAILGPTEALPSPRLHALRRYCRALGTPEAALRSALLLTVEEVEDEPVAILGGDFRRQAAGTDAFARYREIDAQIDATDAAERMLRTDLEVLLPDVFLEKVDRATMAASIEVRVPFLDNEVVDYVLPLPRAYKVTAGEKKRLLRAALRGVVPDAVLDAPKAGFGVPVEAWMRGPMREWWNERVFGGRAMRDGLLDGDRLRTLQAEHVAGRRARGALLWKAAQLAIWWETTSVRIR